MYITYDLEVKTRGGHTTHPKIKRVYVPGEFRGWETGTFKKRTGREVYGVLVIYEQTRQRYRREAYTAKRGETIYEVGPASVGGSSQVFKQIIEIPEKATHVHFYSDVGQLPAEYRHALQAVR